MSGLAKRLPLALTLGEPAGIGPDITLRAWTRRSEHGLPPFYIIGDVEFLARRAKQLSIPAAITPSTPEQAASHFPQALPVVPLDLPVTAAPGKPDATSAPAAIASIDLAVAHVFKRRAAAVVTNPVAKNVLYRAGFPDPGHTEYLARLAQRRTGNPVYPVMMIWSPELAVVPVTVHLPLRDVAAGLTTPLIVKTALIVARDLKERFGIANPRLAVAGLNPHAGEDGTIGGDDKAVIVPAIDQLRAEGILVEGPQPADTMFHAAARALYDAALCMYHDQALIPVKTLAFDRAVNVTLGLPFIRTSPDHGTAFAVAGTPRGNPTSLIEAIKLADRIAAVSPVPSPVAAALVP
ncbi:MAG: 4-hydroxythreonine-4-phosphate dehydrogenase PdxA [Pseudolabrys sp.]|nr:4-hydroxythreonine-4-phosphate dehydrogenase PdxA [Pseudolabrys sp.]